MSSSLSQLPVSSSGDKGTFCSANILYKADVARWVVSTILRHSRNSTLVKSVCETPPKPLFWTPPLYQDLSTWYWTVKNTIVDKIKIFCAVITSTCSTVNYSELQENIRNWRKWRDNKKALGLTCPKLNVWAPVLSQRKVVFFVFGLVFEALCKRKRC